MRVLYVNLEYPNWHDASHWGYINNLAVESGFVANGVEFYTLPATHRYGGKIPFFVDHARTLLNGQKFDQVWFELVHSDISDDVMEFLCSLAPIRLAFSVESLELLPEEWQNNPNACRIREEILAKRLQKLTHLLTTDELDAKRLDGKNGLKARPFPPGFVVPREFICDDPPPPPLNLGLFYGALYGERKQWLEMPRLMPLLRYGASSPELHTPYPQAFDQLHQQMNVILGSGKVDQGVLDLYLNGVRLIRKECYKLWLEGLRIGAAVVNLPQWGRAYAGRVIDGMAAGRPVITREMPGRPIAKAAFEDGKEILLYRTPDELAAHLERVIADPLYARTIATNARKRILAEHTTESYIRELLDWLN